MHELRTREETERALARTGVIFKHSTRCPVSYDVHDEVERFAAAHPEVVVWKVDVVASRPLSQQIAHATGVTHQSPQVLVIEDGRVVWHASHYAVTTAAIERHLGA